MPILVHCSFNNHLFASIIIAHFFRARRLRKLAAAKRFFVLRSCAALWLVRFQTSLLPDRSFSSLYSWCNFSGVMIGYGLMKLTFKRDHCWVLAFFVVKCQYFVCCFLNTWQQWHALQHFAIPVLLIQTMWILADRRFHASPFWMH